MSTGKAAASRGGNLVIASNRLPLTLTIGEEQQVGFEPSSGGLVSALAGTDAAQTWVGWPGAPVPDELQEEVRLKTREAGCEPVFLSASEEDVFYGQICNDTLWPLFHYFVDRLRFTSEAWSTYVEINERFADAIAEISPQGGRVWIHDFHLCLVPRALRERRPDLAIGFFLHVPFPSSEIYRVLPAREELLLGMLGADYIGFHTGDYTRHFRSACLRVLGIESGAESIEYDNRAIGIGVNPIGIDVTSFKRTLADPETSANEHDLDERYEGRKLVLGVERLDYTKGIPQKLAAFERILEQDPARAETITMLQVLVPSRLQSPEYQAKRDEIEMMIAHINGRFGGPGRTPVEYIHRGISQSELAALYRRADVMMVTPLRDGMNLVAQEFVLCQATAPEEADSWRGALLLSEFAGASHVLPGAVLVNPWDANALAGRLLEALALDQTERRRRLELMVDRVEGLDSRNWADGFLARLDRFAAPVRSAARPFDAHARAEVADRLAAASSRTLLLDYDGTLREIMSHPDLASPTAEIRELLRSLAELPSTSVHLVSGRTRESLEAWFGDLPVHLCAEHGYLERPLGEAWRVAADVDLSWVPQVEELFEQVTADVPGTMIERKTAGIAWHYREAEPEYGSWRARELLVALDGILGGMPAEVLPGRRVVEVRARGVNKGAYVERLLPRLPRKGAILAAGDDVTDIDLFMALPRGSVALHVGTVIGLAGTADLEQQYRVDSPRKLRDALQEIVERLRAETPGGLSDRQRARQHRRERSRTRR